MDEEAGQLRELLEGRLDESERKALETQLDHRPALRRKLADLAVEVEATRPGHAIRVRSFASRADAIPLEGVDVGGTLGQGGMAIVRLGRQLKLDRSVAVKTLRQDRQTDEDVARLLHEARVTGRLEHPNIVPIHDIVRGDDGIPQVVLKLIEGHTWTKLMGDAERVRSLFGATDLLDWNLGVLMAVARALAFAHSRNVIHRDVKPANVMVGSFGEVYLLDWGIARDLGDPDDQARAFELAGTTGYMAPEQLLGRDDRIGSWTDTYLLGATLYHLLSGHPPYAGVPLDERVAAAAKGTIAVAPLPAHVPAELRRIAERAMDPDLERRTQRPEDVRLAVATFLQHRAALHLVERGHRERSLAERAAEEGNEPEWERACVSAELSYRAALEEWNECDAASRGLRDVAIARIERALAHDDALGATRLADAHADLPEELRRRIAASREIAENEAARLRRLVTDADRKFGHKVRGIFGGVGGLIWVGYWCVVAFDPPKTVGPLVAFTVIFAAVGLTVIATRGKELLANRLNRTSVLLIAAGMAATVVWCLGASALGLDMRSIIAGLLLVSALFNSGMGILMDPWGNVSAVFFAGCFLAACYRPDWTPYAVVAGNVVLLVTQVTLSIFRPRVGFQKMPKVRAGTRA